MTGSKGVRVAVLGTGAIAQVAHLPTLARMRGVELGGLYDADRSKARTLAQRFGEPRVYASPDELWEDDSVDAVVVCTPSKLHEQHVLEALDAGKFVFCEKPLALSSDGAARVLKAAGDSGRLQVGMNQRFRPDAAALRTFVESGELGTVHYIRGSWLNRRAGRSRRSWRQRKDVAGGGALMDLGIQFLDLALWLLDYPAPRRVVATAHATENNEVEDTALLLLELENGTVITLDVTWTFVADRERQELQVVATKGSASLSPLRLFRTTDEGTLDLSPQLGSGRENQFTASYRRELQHFVDALRSGEPIPPPTEQVTLMTVIDAAYRSMEQGTEVILDIGR